MSIVNDAPSDLSGNGQGLIDLIHRRMQAVNAMDTEGVLAVYDEFSVFVVDVNRGTALLRKERIKEWLGDLRARARGIRTEYTLTDQGLFIRMDWTAHPASAPSFSGVDLFWGDNHRIVRQEAYWDSSVAH